MTILETHTLETIIKRIPCLKFLEIQELVQRTNIKK